MKFDYLVTVITVQEVDDDRNEIRTIAHAALDFSGENYVITYKEHDSDGREIVTSLDVREGRRIYVNRNGEISTDMVIALGERTYSRHTTPYGVMFMDICAKGIISDMTEQGGTLRFSYSTEADRKPIGTITFDVEIRKKNTVN